jgi:hypothetical protein
VGTRFETKTGGEELELTDKLCALGCRKELRDIGLQCRGSRVCRFEHPSTVRGQAHSMGSTVIWMRFAFGVPKTLEIVDKPDHDVSVDAEGVGQLLLSRAVSGGQAIHHREMTRLHLERFESLGKRRGDVMPDLGQKENRSTIERFEALLRWL